MYANAQRWVFRAALKDSNDIATLKFSPYMDLNSVKSYLQNNRNNFTVFTLNVQSLNSKFSEIQSLISDLSKENLLFDAICFQETWLHTNDDVGIFHLPTYNIIHKGNICCGHGGLVIYLNNRYTHTLRSDLYTDSTIWEGLFIDILTYFTLVGVVSSDVSRSSCTTSFPPC